MQSQKLITFSVNALAVPAHAHKRGRPTKPEELQIERELWPFFEKGFAARFIAIKTGYDVKTVYNHYKKFREQVVDYIIPNFIQRCKEEKENAFTLLMR
jgi:hypothetical protein